MSTSSDDSEIRCQYEHEVDESLLTGEPDTLSDSPYNQWVIAAAQGNYRESLPKFEGRPLETLLLKATYTRLIRGFADALDRPTQ